MNNILRFKTSDIYTWLRYIENNTEIILKWLDKNYEYDVSQISYIDKEGNFIVELTCKRIDG